MSKDTAIHIKLEYGESMGAKKDVLSSEMRLLKLAQAIKRYGEYRIREAELKRDFAKKIKEIKTNIGKLQRELPKPRLPEILKKSEEEKESPKAKKISFDASLEEQIKEIENRLNELKVM
ncbi:hypothetical protein FJZ20_01275 [Candidatus Pacearchaeota archaeon]|nr:hypothetical protein [Candidatus Pacearchaeota archaeon]